MRLCAVTIILFTAHLHYGQDFTGPDTDSLKRVLQSPELHDTVKVKVLASIGWNYIGSNGDSALIYIDNALALANSIQYKLGQANALNYKGKYFASMDRFYEAMEFFMNSIELTGYHEEEKVRLVTYYDLGQLYAKLCARSPSEALSRKRIEYYLKALSLLDVVTNYEDRDEFLVGVYLELARAYTPIRGPKGIMFGQIDSAKYYAYQAITAAREHHMQFFITAGYNDIANFEYNTGNYSEAIKIQKIALRESAPGNPFQSMLYMSQAKFYSGAGYYDSAESALENAVKVDPSLRSATYYYQIFAEVAEKQNRNQESIKAWLQMLKIAEASSSLFDIEIAANNLAWNYEKIGDFRRALKYQQMARSADSVYNEDLYLRMQDLQSQSDMAAQEARINLLSKDAEIQNLALKNSKNFQMLTLVFLALAVTGVVIMVILYRALRTSKQAQADAFKKVDRMKSQFFENISHEFRTPLTLILSPLSKRLQQSTNADDKAELTVMHKNASALLNLVNEMLDLSKLEAGRLSMVFSNSNITQVVGEVVSQFTSVAETKQIHFRPELQNDVWAQVDVDKIIKITTNLLSNAFKFTHAGGAVSIRLTRHDGFFRLEVIDDGIGIEQTDQRRIFDRFFQIDNSSTVANPGTGIGLALCKELVDLHKGTIRVISELGKGSTFSIELPLKAVEPVKVLPRDQHILVESSPFAGSGVTENTGDLVLIIEDNEDLRAYLSKELATEYKVMTAEDGIAGIKAARENIPTLIISDVMMPGKNGFEVCDEIKSDELTCHVPVILLTAKADAESKTAGYKTGADEYLAKPFDPGELKIRIANLIENRKRLQEKFVRQLRLRPSEVRVDSLDEAFIKKAMEIMESRMADESFTISTFANEIGMSQPSFYRKILALTGLSPNEFVRNMRLQRAMALLQQNAGNVSDIAYQVGFSNHSYFSKLYKEKYGITPSEQLKNVID